MGTQSPSPRARIRSAVTYRAARRNLMRAAKLLRRWRELERLTVRHKYADQIWVGGKFR